MKKQINIPLEKISIEGFDDTSERFVLLVDLMGFKDFVMSKSHSEVLERMKLVSESVEQHNEARTIDVSGETDEIVTNVALFSDTIVVWTNKADNNSLLALIFSASLLAGDLFKNNIPFRGAIARGEFTASKRDSIFVGKPLINAFLLSEDLNFFGTVLHHSAEPCFTENSHCIEAQVATKKGKARHYLVVPDIALTAEECSKLPGQSISYPAQGPALLKMLEGLFEGRSGSMRVYAENTMRAYEKQISKGTKNFDSRKKL